MNSLVIGIFMVCELTLAAAPAPTVKPLVSATPFSKILRDIGDSHPKSLARKLVAAAKRENQIGKKLVWTPSLSASAARPIRKWGTDVGEVATVSAELNILKFGGDYATVQEGRKLQQQADIDEKLSVIDVEAAAAKIFFQNLQLRRNIESQKNLLDGKRELVRVAKERYRRGQLPFQESEKVGLDARNAEIQLRQSEVEYLALLAQLKNYLPTVQELEEWPWTEIAENAKEKTKTRFKANVKERLAYQSLQIDADVARHQAMSATSGWLPRLDITSQWSSPETSPIREKDGEWNSLLVLTVPLWDRGMALSARREALFRQEANQENLKDFELSEGARVAVFSERRQKLAENLLVAKENAVKSKSLATDSFRRFQLGRSSVNDLLLDQSRVYEAEIFSQSAQLEFHQVLLEECILADVRPSECFK